MSYYEKSLKFFFFKVGFKLKESYRDIRKIKIEKGV